MSLRPVAGVQVIAAEGEQKASKSLAEASAVMSESCAALQLRYLQVGRAKNKSLHRVVRRTIICGLHFYSQQLHVLSAGIISATRSLADFCISDAEFNLRGEELHGYLPLAAGPDPQPGGVIPVQSVGRGGHNSFVRL